MSYESGTRNRLVISYLTLRKAIGYLGTALPFVLSIGGMLIYSLAIQGSLSSYYHTGMRDVFVGTLCAIGIFLFAYKGYEQQDNLAGNLAGICAVGNSAVPDDARYTLCFRRDYRHGSHCICSGFLHDACLFLSGSLYKN